jgi:hypothetical protein
MIKLSYLKKLVFLPEVFCFALSFALYCFVPARESYWVMLTTLLPLIFTKQLKRLFYISISSWLIILSVAIVPWVFIPIVYLALFFGERKKVTWCYAFVCSFFSLISFVEPVQSFWMRALWCLIGFSSAMFTVFFLKLFFRKVMQNFLFKKCLESFNVWLDILFQCFISKKYPEEKQKFSARLQKSKLNFLSRIQGFPLGLFSRLFEQVCALENILIRVSDHTIFEFMQRELYAISADLNVVLQALINNKDAVESIQTLQTEILILESIYENTLGVLTAQPSALLVFIENLQDLINSLDELNRMKLYEKDIQDH